MDQLRYAIYEAVEADRLKSWHPGETTLVVYVAASPRQTHRNT